VSKTTGKLREQPRTSANNQPNPVDPETAAKKLRTPTTEVVHANGEEGNPKLFLILKSYCIFLRVRCNW